MTALLPKQPPRHPVVIQLNAGAAQPCAVRAQPMAPTTKYGAEERHQQVDP